MKVSKQSNKVEIVQLFGSVLRCADSAAVASSQKNKFFAQPSDGCSTQWNMQAE